MYVLHWHLIRFAQLILSILTHTCSQFVALPVQTRRTNSGSAGVQKGLLSTEPVVVGRCPNLDVLCRYYRIYRIGAWLGYRITKTKALPVTAAANYEINLCHLRINKVS